MASSWSRCSWAPQWRRATPDSRWGSPSASLTPSSRCSRSHSDRAHVVGGGSRGGSHGIAKSVLAVIAPVCVIAALLLDRLVPAVFGTDYADASSPRSVRLSRSSSWPPSPRSWRTSRRYTSGRSRGGERAGFGGGLRDGGAAPTGRWGATKASSATLSGVAAGALVSVVMLRHDFSRRLAYLSFAAVGVCRGRGRRLMKAPHRVRRGADP